MMRLCMKQNVAEATVAPARLLSRQTRPGQIPRMCLAGPKLGGAVIIGGGVVCALAEPCAAIVVGVGGLGAAGVAVSQ